MSSFFRLTGKVLMWTAIVVALAFGTGFLAFEISPRPWIPVIRHTFEKGGKAAAATFTPYIPTDVSSQLDLSYAPGNPNAKLDIFYPEAITNHPIQLPTIVWVHGGGWIAGEREGLTGYQKILAHQGFTTVNIEYSHAPQTHYPTPVRELNQAMAFLDSHAEEFHIDRNQFVVAGDSAGAQIVSQYANVVSSPAYASLMGIEPSIRRSQLAAAILYCGVYDLVHPVGNGLVVKAGKAMVWAYLGSNKIDDPKFEALHLSRHITAQYPPTFISDGNLDLLMPQSERLAAALKEHGVQVDTLFFPKDSPTKTNHEYQFLFDTEVAHESFQRMVAFLNGVVHKPELPGV